MTGREIRDWQQLLRFRCTGCGHCCRETIVPLTDSDVRRIVDATGTRTRSFVRFFGEDEVQMPKRDPQWIRLGRRVVMALRWQRRRCVFLDGEQRCTIYDHRPLACRAYPFTPTFSPTGGVEGLSMSNIVECLYELDGTLSRRELTALARRNAQESGQYQALVKIWNRKPNGPRTRGAFMRFLNLEWHSRSLEPRGRSRGGSTHGAWPGSRTRSSLPYSKTRAKNRSIAYKLS